MKRNKRTATVSKCLLPCCTAGSSSYSPGDDAMHKHDNVTTRNTAKRTKSKNSCQTSHSQEDDAMHNHDNVTTRNIAKGTKSKNLSRRNKYKQNANNPPTPSRPSTTHRVLPTHSHLPPLQVLQSSDTSTDSEESDDSERDDDFFNLDSVVNNHTYNLAGNIGLSQFEEPVSTPISHSIPNKIIRKIQSNKFVDFASLLPNMALSMSHQDQFSLTVNSKNHLSLVPSTNTKRIHNIDCWTTAFLRFAAVYSATYPHETPQLMKYGEIVRDLASRRPGLAWSYYDCQFRMFRERQVIPWDRIHTEFWVMATTHQPFPVQFPPFQGNRPFRSMPNRSFRSNQTSGRKQSRFLENTCWTYNRRGVCQTPRCLRPHICGFCRGPHHSGQCTYSSKEQALSAVNAPTPTTNHTASTVRTPKK